MFLPNPVYRMIAALKDQSGRIITAKTPRIFTSFAERWGF
jgi:hypothetical protein